MTTLRLPPLATVRDLVKLYRLNAVKQLSQNFLMDEPTIAKIVKKAGKVKDAHIVEIGPGPGGITRAILRKLPEKITVIEKDKRFRPFLGMLQESYAAINGKMDVIYDDILKVNMVNMFPDDVARKWTEDCPRIQLIGNLPFNISTPLIIKWLHEISERRGPWTMGRARMTLTFQKEVAERLCADVGDAQRCRLSVMAQAWTEPRLKFIIPGNAFVPRPDVDVGVVTFTPLVQPRTSHDFKLFEKVTRHVFCYRQKFNIKCIETLFPVELRKQLSLMMFGLCEINPNLISTQLTVEDIDKLCTAYKYLCEKHPEIVNYSFRASNKILKPSMTRDVQVEAAIM